MVDLISKLTSKSNYKIKITVVFFFLFEQIIINTNRAMRMIRITESIIIAKLIMEINRTNLHYYYMVFIMSISNITFRVLRVT